MKFIKFLIKKLNLIIILAIYLLYFILFFLGLDVSYGSIIFAITHVLVFTTLLYSIFRIIFPKNKEKSSGKNVAKKSSQIDNNTLKNKSDNKKEVNNNVVYYEVKQDNRYMFAEYPDRYELFLKTDSGLKYVKTDYKKDVEKKWYNYIQKNRLIK